MTNEPIIIRSTIPGIRPYPPLIFAWQKWPMKFSHINALGLIVRVSIDVYYQRDGVVYAQQWQGEFTPKKVGKIYFDERGPTNKSMERFYEMAHTWLDALAHLDPTIQAFAPEVVEE